MSVNRLHYIKIINILFLNGDYDTAYKRLNKGELMVVPSGPGLATMGEDLRYTEAVQNADFAIPDSGYMVLLLKLLKGIKIKKLSGYEFLSQFLKEDFKENYLFLVDPNKEESEINNIYLNKIGIPITNSYHYIAPMYGESKIQDQILLDKLNFLENKPKYIMINLGSNVQEPLGYYLKKNLNYKPGIICAGAAISFITGSQANISPLVDRIGLGWLWRCISRPSVFIPRYLKAIKLIFKIFRTDIKIIP